MSILILYQISNEQHSSTTSYNAFSIPRPPTGTATLSTIKSAHDPTLRRLNPRGSNGYHWRVRIEERPQTSHDSGGANSSYGWWDVQDENARLPTKECTHSDLKKMMRSNKSKKSGEESELQEVTKAAKGAMKYMGKAMNAVAGGGGEEDTGERVTVICFKLLDLTKLSGGVGVGAKRGMVRQRVGSNQSVNRAAPVSAGSRLPPQQQRATASRPPAPVAKAVPTANLMDFHPPSQASAPRTPSLSHSNSMPVAATGSLPNETRAEKLKREYALKASTSNRIWDEVDQRWVEGPVQNGETKSNAAINETAKSIKGITLDASNAIGKSESVASAINARVAEMESSKQKAVSELREREAAKASADAEEESVRIRLEPKLRAWSEEHGKKKQLRALLANLHTILWEGSGWKAISLADVLDDSKVKRVYHRASRVVHPDKTGGLDAEKRFVAKRVFDALTQAKVDFDNGAK